MACNRFKHSRKDSDIFVVHHSAGGRSMKMNKKALAILSAGHLVTDVNQGALPALLPFFKEALQLSYTMAGTILLFGNISSSVIQPVFGYLSDKKPQKWFLPVTPLIACLGMAISGFIPSYFLLLAVVVVTGIGIASFHPEAYKTAYSFTGDKKATGMSVFSVGGNLGMGLGPIFAVSLVTHLGLPGTLWMIVPGILISGALLFLISWFSSTDQRAMAPTRAEVKQSPAQTDKVSLILLVCAATFRYWAHMGLVTYIPFYYINYLKGDPVYAGMLTSTFLIAGAVGTLIGAPLADRWGHRNYLALTLILIPPLLLLFYNSTGFVSFIILGLTGMIILSTFTVVIVMAQTLLPRYLGMASGLMVGFSVGTGGVGVTLLGMIADRWGVPMAMKAILILPLISFVLTLFIKYPPKKQESG
jgi:FSR family fosmidomycin resistance protein-like MFS transporter